MRYCAHCGKVTFHRFLCECNRLHGTKGHWVYVCEGVECRWCLGCTCAASDIWTTCSYTCSEFIDSQVDLENVSCQAFRAGAAVPSRTLSLEDTAADRYLFLFDLKFVFAIYTWQEPDDVINIEFRPHACKLISVLLEQPTVQLGFCSPLTAENASIVTTKLLESTTKTRWKSKLPNLPEVQEENGLTVWLFDESLCEAHPTDVGRSGTPLHLRNLDLILSAAEPVTKFKPKLSKSSLVYVTCDTDKSCIDEASWRNVLCINGWWEENDYHLLRLLIYLGDFLFQKPLDVRDYLEANLFKFNDELDICIAECVQTIQSYHSRWICF